MKKPPPHWNEQGDVHLEGIIAAKRWTHRLIPLHVLRSVSDYRNEKWIHVSVSHPHRIPSWDDLKKVKDEFIGEDKEAYQVIAANQDHVNCHPRCMHLWAPLDGTRRVANLHELTMEVAG